MFKKILTDKAYQSKAAALLFCIRISDNRKKDRKYGSQHNINTTQTLPASQAPLESGLVLLLQPTLAFLWDVLFFQLTDKASELTGSVQIVFAAIYKQEVPRTPYLK